MLAERLFPSEAGSLLVDNLVNTVSERASRTFDHLQHGICALQGHQLLLHFETDRLSLRCAACGWNSPGWTVEGGHPQPRNKST